eukprot:1125035-Rhodomonas_salina.1
MCQGQYVKDILDRFGMTGANPVATLMEQNIHLVTADCPAPEDINPAFRREYQRIVGALIYLGCFTRPDISHS